LIKPNLVKSVVIDSVAPETTISNVYAGIDWTETDTVKAAILDQGVGLSNVTYQLDNQNPVNWTGSNGNWSQSASGLLNWNDSSQQGVHSLTIAAMDKAGNEQKQVINFSVAKPLVWNDDDQWIDDGTPSNPSQPDGLPGAPPPGSGGSGGGSGTGYYGWRDGVWGASYGGSWYSNGIIDPSNIPTSWLPFGGIPNNEPNTYRSRLEKILKTAIAVMPSSSTKKAALKNRMTLLIEAGAYLSGDSGDHIYYGYEGGSIVDQSYWQDKFFKGSLRKAMNQSVNTTTLGIELAKELMNSADSIRSLTFQTLVETVVGAAHLERNWFSPYLEKSTRETARELARTYGLLKPQGDVLTGNFGWLDKLWDLTESPANLNRTSIRNLLFADNTSQAGGIVGDIVRSMHNLRSNSNESSDLKLLQMSDRLLKSAVTIGEWRSDLETTEFSQALLNFGHEVLKVNPTVDATNATEVSTWIETLLEGGDVKMASAGMSSCMRRITPSLERGKALDFFVRLLQTVQALENSTVKAQITRSDLLSELLNFGGAYISLKPAQSSISSDYFLANIWNDIQSRNMAYSARKLQEFLTSEQIENYRDLLTYQTNVYLAVSTYEQEGIFRRAAIPKNLLSQDEIQIAANPYAYRYGSFVHSQISLQYQFRHTPDRVLVDNRISTIIKEYQRDYPDLDIEIRNLSAYEQSNSPDKFQVGQALRVPYSRSFW
jgi:hypothetical protein